MSTPFAGPQIPTLVQHILDRIDLGQLNPGDLLDEAELSETHGVSRTPVREAILYLEALGLVRNRLPGFEQRPLQHVLGSGLRKLCQRLLEFLQA